MLNNPIVCLCNFGMVRSFTMAKVLEERGYTSKALGMLNNSPDYLNEELAKAGTVIICNKPNVERGFKKDTDEKHADGILNVLDKYEEKTLVCDTIGFDRWGIPMHQEIIDRCNKYLESIGE